MRSWNLFIGSLGKLGHWNDGLRWTKGFRLEMMPFLSSIPWMSWIPREHWKVLEFWTLSNSCTIPRLSVTFSILGWSWWLRALPCRLLWCLDLEGPWANGNSTGHTLISQVITWYHIYHISLQFWSKMIYHIGTSCYLKKSCFFAGFPHVSEARTPGWPSVYLVPRAPPIHSLGWRPVFHAS